MTKLTWKELIAIIEKHNEDYDVQNQFGDKHHLECVVVFNDIKSWGKEYPLESKSYAFTSDNKYFIKRMCGSSIFADTLDKTDNIRLDWYLGEWVIDYCYIKEN